MNKRKSSRIAIAMMSLLAMMIIATVVARPAFAGTLQTGLVTYIGYQYEPSGEQLVLQQNTGGSTYYFAQQTSPGCGIPGLSADAIKLFATIAQAGYLAGKNVTINYTTCSGYPFLTAVSVAN